MTTAYDVPAQELIERSALGMKEIPEFQPPEWASYVKTGVHKELPPEQDDWWYVRLSAVLRKVYMNGPIGTERLSAMFGGKEDRGSKMYKARKGSRAIVRRALIDLEKAGFIERFKNKGRRVTSKGQAFLDNAAYEVAKEIATSGSGKE